MLPGNADRGAVLIDAPLPDDVSGKKDGEGGPPTDLNLDPLLIELLKKIHQQPIAGPAQSAFDGSRRSQ